MIFEKLNILRFHNFKSYSKRIVCGLVLFFLCTSADAVRVQSITEEYKKPKETNWFRAQLGHFMSYPLLDRFFRLMELGEYAEARDELKMLLAIQPNNPQILMSDIIILDQLGDNDTIIVQASKLLEIVPAHIKALMYRAFAYQRIGQYQKSIDDLRKVISFSDIERSDKHLAHQTLVDLLIKQENFDEAEAVLKEISDPYLVASREAVISGRQNRNREAADIYRATIKLAANEKERNDAFMGYCLQIHNLDIVDYAKNAVNDFLAEKGEDPDILRCLMQVADNNKLYSDVEVLYSQLKEKDVTIADLEYLAKAYGASGKLSNAVVVYNHAISLNPTADKKEHLYMARGYAQNKLKLYDLAIKDFRAAYKLSKKPDLLMVIGQNQIDFGDVDAAIKTYEDLVNISNQPEDAWLKLGVLYSQEDRLDEAKSKLKNILDKSENKHHRFMACRELGRIAFKQGRYDEAKEHLLKAIDIDDSDPYIYDYLGMLYHKIKDYPAAITLFKKSLEIKNKPSVLKRLAAVYQENGENDKVESIYRQRIADDRTPQKEKAVLLADLGQLKMNIKDYDSAWRYLHEAKKIGHDNWRLYYDLGFVAIMKEEWEEAIKELTKAKSMEQSPELNIFLAHSYSKIKENDLALQAIVEVQKDIAALSDEQRGYLLRLKGLLHSLESNHIEAITALGESLKYDYKIQTLINLARLHRLEEENTLAISMLESIDLESLDDDTKVLIYDELANIYDNQNLPEKAHFCLEKANVLKPSAVRFYKIGLYYQNVGLNDLAITAIKEAQSADSDNMEYGKALGYAYLKNEQYHQAISVFESIVDSGDDESWRLYQELGYAYMHLGKNEEAEKWFQKF